jgi:hypothetical protein
MPVAAACAAERTFPPPPLAAPTEAGRLVQDVEYALTAIEARHPDPFHARPRAEFEAQIEALRARGDALSRPEAFLGLMRMVALAGDSETRLGDVSEIADLHLPVHFEWWSDGLWIVLVQHDLHELFGARVLRIAGRPVAELPSALAPWIAHENDVVLRSNCAALASLPRVLEAAGITADLAAIELDLIDARGLERSVELAPRASAQLHPWTFIAPAEWTPPTLRRDWQTPWWWEELESERAVYLQYNHCIWREEEPFADVAQAITARLAARPDLALIVDLRNNIGGDSDVMGPLLEGLRRRPRAARTIALIGAGTYSSGEINAQQLKEQSRAVLVGEPTAQKPDSFGDWRAVELPSTGWLLQVSTKVFRPFGDDRPSLVPDHLVPMGFADVLAGRDPILERALELTRSGG